MSGCEREQGRRGGREGDEGGQGREGSPASALAQMLARLLPLPLLLLLLLLRCCGLRAVGPSICTVTGTVCDADGHVTQLNMRGGFCLLDCGCFCLLVGAAACLLAVEGGCCPPSRVLLLLACLHAHPPPATALPLPSPSHPPTPTQASTCHATFLQATLAPSPSWRHSTWATTTLVGSLTRWLLPWGASCSV